MGLGKKIFVFIPTLLLIGVFCYLYFYKPDNNQYSNMADLAKEYNVNTEMQTARKILKTGIDPLTVYKFSPKEKSIVLTIDGLPDEAMTDKIIALLDKYNIKAVFFIEGSTAALEKNTVKNIYNHKYMIENYTYVGLNQLEKMPLDEILLQLLKTQKVINDITGETPYFFKAPKTEYNARLLRGGAAAGLKAAVESTVYINPQIIKSDDDAINFIKNVKPGSIVSLKVTYPGSRVRYKNKKSNKQTIIKTKTDNNDELQNRIDVLERVLKAIKTENVQVKSLQEYDAKKISRADIKNEHKNILSEVYSKKIFRYIDNVFFAKTYAASSHYEQLRQKNMGKKAQTTKLILTTEPAVCFVFAGLTKPTVVYDILDRLKQMQATGTFFVMKNDIDKHPELIKAIIASGNEIGIGIRSLKGSNFYTTCAEINYVRAKLQVMGVNPKLAMQPWGKITEETREAVSAQNLILIGSLINIVSSKMIDETSAQKVIKGRFGRFVYALGRGWIVYFRLDYYKDNTLVGRVMDLVKRYKIDNIAYHSFDDDHEVNKKNDSSYKIKDIDSVLNNKKYRYQFAVKDEIPQSLRDDYSPIKQKNINFKEYIRERYIGNSVINIESNVLGFSSAEIHSFDTTGRIHTKKPVIFFTFDDWGTDASVNRLLYVLRKHKIKATFFVLTHNVMHNPNLLRAIAEQGNDVGAHSDMHIPMATEDAVTNRQKPSPQSKEEYMKDLSNCYKKLEKVTGNVIIDGRPSLTRYFRPPTLNISRMGFECLYKNNYTYIVDGAYSTHDYKQKTLQGTIIDFKKGIFDRNGKVRNGAILVMHMSDSSQYTATALDMLLTANEQKPDGDPTKFIPIRLSDYLKNNYDQSRPEYDENLEKNMIINLKK